jgi:ATP-dependent RNA helicase DDX3X
MSGFVARSRGGGSRGRGGGRGGGSRGRGGGRGGGSRGRGGGREARKAYRTAVQSRQREKKLDDDANYFFSTCMKYRTQPASNFPKNISEPMSGAEKALFGTITGTVGINFSAYEDIPVKRSGADSDKYPAMKTFQDAALAGVPLFLQRNINLCGYTTPTPVQKHAIPIAVAGLDVMTCAQTGSGKTAAFLLPLLARKLKVRPVDQKFGEDDSACLPIALVMAPTRELAQQIHGEATKFCNRSPFCTVVVYGGSPLKPQLLELSKGTDLIVATPGRLIDMMERGIVSLRQCTYLCLDEADRMLDMGFEPQIRRIVEGADMPKQRQTLMFSATFPREIQKLASDFMKKYVWIGVGRVGSTTENITQHLIATKARQKPDPLLQALRRVEGMTLVFVAKKKTAAWLHHFIKENGNTACAIHGDRTQAERERALADFKSGKARVMVATDVASRGLDISGVAHVVNYDLPGNIDDYIHRIGRTGRAGNVGVSTSFFVQEQGRDCNMNVARGLQKCFKDHNQVVPDFLESLCRGGAGFQHDDGTKADFTDYRKRDTFDSGRGGRGRSNIRGARGRGSASGRGSSRGGRGQGGGTSSNIREGGGRGGTSSNIRGGRSRGGTSSRGGSRGGRGRGRGGSTGGLFIV